MDVSETGWFSERGWLAHLFVSDEDTRSWLAEIGVLADQER